MAKATRGPSTGDVRELARGLAGASDAQVVRVVAVVDHLPVRGGADQLIASLRPRLARLRPPRPLRFARLLFLPLDPLIVPPQRWQPQLPAVPRSVLASLAATVRAGLADEVAAIEGMIHAATFNHADTVMRAGQRLWPPAAALLFSAPEPIGWTETGLNALLYPPLARRVGAILAQATLLQELIAEADAGIAPPRPGPVRVMLGDILDRCPDALNMLVTLLLAKLPSVAALLPTIAPEFGPQVEAALRQASLQASEVLLAGLETSAGTDLAVAGGDLGDAVQSVRRTVALLDQLADRGDLPQGRARVQAVRQRLDAACRSLFSHAMATELLPSLRQLPDRADDPAATAAVEATARRLRELESEARLLGGCDVYDLQLREAATAVRKDGATLTRAARVRLVEILLGPEAAMVLLGGG